MDIVSCLRSKNTRQDPSGHSLEKLSPLLPEMQAGEFDTGRKTTHNRHQRARRFRRRADELVRLFTDHRLHFL